MGQSWAIWPSVICVQGKLLDDTQKSTSVSGKKSWQGAVEKTMELCLEEEISCQKKVNFSGRNLPFIALLLKMM